MNNQSGKVTVASLFAIIIIGYIAYCAFIFISSQLRSDATQKEIIERVGRFRVDERLVSRTTEIIVSTLKDKGYNLDKQDIDAIEVFHDSKRNVVDIYYSFQIEMNFLLFKHIKLVEVEDSMSTVRWN